jgi:hypothetical protein
LAHVEPSLRKRRGNSSTHVYKMEQKISLSPGSYQSEYWSRHEGTRRPLTKLLHNLVTNANASKPHSDTPGDKEDGDLAEFLAAMPCPPFDRLRATTMPDAFANEERPFQLWRYEMHMLTSEISSPQIRESYQVTLVTLCAALTSVVPQEPLTTVCTGQRSVD